MKAPKVLVAAPNSFHKNYVATEYFSVVKNLTYPNYDLFFVDNSPNNCNKELYESLGLKYKWVNPENKSSILFIWESQNEIRNYFLDNKEYEYLMFIETDLIPPPDIIEKLIVHQKPVVGAPYFIGKLEKTILMNQEVDEFWTIGETRNKTIEESFLMCDGKLKQAFSIGFGCTLIERFVIAHFPFRYMPDEHVQNDASNPAHADSFFYSDLFINYLDVYLDTSLIIEHKNQDWEKLNL